MKKNQAFLDNLESNIDSISDDDVLEQLGEEDGKKFIFLRNNEKKSPKQKRDYKKLTQILKSQLKTRHPIMNQLKKLELPLFRYIREGEANGFNKIVSVLGNTYWFYLENVITFEACLSIFYWRLFINPIKTKWDYVISDSFVYVKPKDVENRDLLFAWINTNLMQFFIETMSRRAKGVRLDRIQMKVYEVNQLPCPDFNNFTAEQKKDILEKWNDLLETDLEVDLNAIPSTDQDDQTKIQKEWYRKRVELDKAFLRVIFPINLLKYPESVKLTKKELIDFNSFQIKTYELVCEWWDEIFSKYDDNQYDDFISYLIELVLNENQEMLRSS